MWESESYLMHHGVKGQKWGVRRYQNEDGTLTDAGKRKYLTDGGGLTRAGVRRIKKELKRSEKLKRRANLGAQQADVEKYGRRAKTAGKVALGAGGAALALQGGVKPLIESVGKRIHAKDMANLERIDNEAAGIRSRAWDTMVKYADRNGWTSDPNKVRGYNKVYEDAKNQLMSNDSAYRVHRAKSASHRARIYGALDGVQVAAVLATGVAVGAAGVTAYSKIRQKMAEKNIRDINSGEAQKRYKEHSQSLVKAFGSKTINDVKQFDSKRKRRR